MRLTSRAGDTSLRALITDRVAPASSTRPSTTRHAGQRHHHRLLGLGHHLPEYKVTAVQVSPSNGPSEWQEDYSELSPAPAASPPRWKLRSDDRWVHKDPSPTLPHKGEGE